MASQDQPDPGAAQRFDDVEIFFARDQKIRSTPSFSKADTSRSEPFMR